jgi:NADH-quinone oxidoreductase subunit N
MISFDDLLPLLPLLITTVSVVLTMLAIAIRRSFIVSGAITIIGLSIAAFLALRMMPFTDQQITPLFIIDQYSLVFTVVCCAAGLFVAIFSFPYFFRLEDQKEEFYLLLGIATIGAIVMVSTNHFIGMILGVETLNMALYGMIAYPLHSKHAAKNSLEAAIKYLVLSAAASGFILFGIALVYMQTGSLEFSQLSLSSNEVVLSEGYTVLALMLIVSGISFKLSLAPFHMWTPDVYEGAPLPAAAYLATIGKMAMFVVFLRFVTISGALSFGSVLAAFSFVAILSIMIGNLLALIQQNLKRLLAYSSIAHMGYLMIAVVASFSIDNTFSVEAISFYLIAYVVMSLGAFAAISVVSSSENEFDSLSDFQGLFWRSPWLAAIFTGMLLSLAGIPLTVGFIAKFYIFFTGVESSLWVLLATLVIGSGIGLFYYLRVIYTMLLPRRSEEEQFPIAGAESLSSYFVLGVLFILLIFLGVYPAPLMTLLEGAARLV